MRRPSRRTVLAGGAALGALGIVGGTYGLVEADVLPGRLPLDRALGRCDVGPVTPSGTPATVRVQAFRSRFRRTDVTMALVTPSGAGSGLPVVVALHGWGDTARRVVDHIALDRYLGNAVAHGLSPLAIVAVDGGATYWHPRASGDDPHRMITDEVLPRLDQAGLRTERIGLLGWSMGGYGALLLGETLGPARVAAVAASSPAVFPSYDNARRTNARAFDSRADFERYDVLAGLDRLRGVATWVDCGHSDPFAGVTQRIRRRLGSHDGGLFGGCHDGIYWRRRTPQHLAFLAHHLR